MSLPLSEDTGISVCGFGSSGLADDVLAAARGPICYLLGYLEGRETDLSGICWTDCSWLVGSIFFQAQISDLSV